MRSTIIILYMEGDRTLKTAALILLISAGTFTLLSAAAGLFLYFYAIHRKKERVSLSGFKGQYGQYIEKGQRWLNSQNLETLELTAFDGAKLVGYLLRAENSPRGAILMMHGYRSTYKVDFSWSAKWAHERGYDLLMVRQRGCGESGGNAVCFGVLERFDCRDWAYLLQSMEPEGLPLFLCGLSLGSSSVLMATGLSLPSSVRGVIADCGFTSAHDEFVWLIQKKRWIPGWRLAYAFTWLYSRVFSRFGFKDCSTLDALKRNDIPVIFFHGGSDRFVPTEFSVKNYLACSSAKELVIIPEATHGVSWLANEELYTSRLTAFLERYGSYENRS